MKKYGYTVLLGLICLLLTGPAMAAVRDDAVHMTISVADGTIYIGPNNDPYDEHSAEPLFDCAARALLYADDARLVYAMRDDQNAAIDVDANWLMVVERLADDPEPHLIDAILGSAVTVMQDGLIYYVPQENPSLLRAFRPLLGAYEDVAPLDEPIVALHESLGGVIVETGSGEQLWIAALGQFIKAPVSLEGATLEVFDHLELILSAEGTLSVLSGGMSLDKAVKLDDQVLCATALNGAVFALRKGEADTEWIRYQPSTGERVLIGKFKGEMQPMITAAGDGVFVMTRLGHIYRADAAHYAVTSVATVQDIAAPVLVATPGQLLIYDASALDGSLKYAMSIALANDIEPAPAPVEEPEAEPETTPEVRPTPDPEPAMLSRGSRGDEVRELQKLLIAHGYLSGKADGIFGRSTESALKYLQFDMGNAQTGTVTEARLTSLMTSKNLPHNDKYRALHPGDNGVRVYDMQARLHALNWLRAKPNGNFGPQTENAVKAFAGVNNFKANGTATEAMLKFLYGKNAPDNLAADNDPEPAAPKPTPAPTHKPGGSKQSPDITDDDLIELCRTLNDLFPGGNYSKKKAVFALQDRLYDLGYLKKNQRSKVYDNATLSAVKHFQAAHVDMPHFSGLPTRETVEEMFRPVKLLGMVR